MTGTKLIARRFFKTLFALAHEKKVVSYVQDFTLNLIVLLLFKSSSSSTSIMSVTGVSTRCVKFFEVELQPAVPVPGVVEQ